MNLAQNLHAPAFGILWHDERQQPRRAQLQKARDERDQARKERDELRVQAKHHAREATKARAQRDRIAEEADHLHRMHGAARLIASQIHITQHDGTALVPAHQLEQLLAAVGIVRKINGGME